jgi:hypothetical protein
MQECTTAMRVRRDGGALLDRLIEVPLIAEVVPRLPPETLHGLIDRCGLEACGALMALATPAQVAHVLDLDLWRRSEAGLDEQFDADRFGVWLEVLVDQGADVAARLIERLDIDLVAAGLAQHARIFDIATLEGYVTTDGTEIPAVIEPDGGLACDIAGRRLIARRPDAWDAIVAVLAELHASYPVAFVRLMHACSRLSHSRPELDGLDALLGRGAQWLFDLADARARRREAHGFASPAQARAFLETSRRVRLDAGGRPTGTIPRPPVTPDARAPADGPREAEAGDMAARAAATLVFDLLRDEGVVAAPPRALLEGALAQGSSVARLHAHMQEVFARDPMAAAARQEELAWLANVLVAGGRIDARAFTAREASDAAIATCNLGLESWPAAWRDDGPLADDFLVGQDLVTVFQVGWTVLHDDVCVAAASGLLDALSGLPRHDAETQAGLDDLRTILLRQLRAGTPWRSRDALDALASLDLLAWTTLLAVIAECPVLPATIDPSATTGRHRVDPSAFAFIAERRQLTAVQAFVRALPGLLRG